MKKVIGASLIIGLFAIIFVGQAIRYGIKEAFFGFLVSAGVVFIVWAGVTLWQDKE